MSWLLKFWDSTVGKKVVMAVTGILLVGFVFTHMLGNLQMFLGADAMNRYAAFLKSTGELLWVARAGLFTAAVLVAGDLDVEAAAPLTSFPLWSIHGGRDALVRPDADRAFAALTEARGGVARYTELRDAGHDVWREAFAHEPLWDWLFAQHR